VSATTLRFTRLWGYVDAACLPLLLVGVFGAAARWHPAAYLLVAAVAVPVVGHVAVAVAAYRDVMRRPWPKVAPTAPDDD
jgi:hypothetical protein